MGCNGHNVNMYQCHYETGRWADFHVKLHFFVSISICDLDIDKRFKNGFASTPSSCFPGIVIGHFCIFFRNPIGKNRSVLSVEKPLVEA